MNNKCPIHKVEFKTIPAGVSKKTGRPYPAFEVCPVEGCNEKPQAPLDPQEPLDAKILEEKENDAIERDKRRTYRIERQHSQNMSIEFLKVLVATKQLTEVSTELVTKYTDHFMSDLDKEEVKNDYETF